MKHFAINKAIAVFALMMGLLFTHFACAQTTENKQETDVSVPDDDDDNDNETLANYLDSRYRGHEISFFGAGAFSSLQNHPASGKSTAGFGGSLGIGYTCFLNKQWGVSSGLEYAFYSGKTGLYDFSKSYETTDIFNNPIVYTVRTDHYREKQYVGMLNFPLSVLYQTGSNHPFFISTGFKIGLPVSAKYRGNPFVWTASGYYPDYNQTEIWQNDLGYGVFNSNGKNGKLNVRVAAMGTVETGIKWNTGSCTALYTGVFVDYGLNDVLKNYDSKKQFVEYNRDEPGQPAVNTACVLMNRFSPLAFGVKVKYAFTIGCSDWLNVRKANKNLKSTGKQDESAYDELYAAAKQDDRVERNTPVTVLENTDLSETKEEEQSQTNSTDREERQAYLEAASERRRTYSRLMDVPDYDRGIVSLTAEQKSALDDYIEFLAENQTLRLEITGHCCDLGSEELNEQIGQERADLAKDYLVEKGVLPSRILTFSKGKTEPLYPNNNEENRRKNRRLEIKIRE